jgi:MFS family permease
MTTAALPSPTFKSRSRQILLAGFAGSFFSVGFSVYLFGVFQSAMLETFESGVTLFGFAPAMSSVISGILSPIVGRSLTTRGRPGLSVRRVMVAGAASIGLGLILVSRMESLATAGLFFALLVSPGTVMLGPLVTQAMVTNWFDANRGRALGIVAAGTTVAGGIVPVVAALLIESFGWRDAMGILGVTMLAIPLPISALLARSSPEEVGEVADGIPVAGASGARTEAPHTTRELLRNRYLWLVGIMFGLQFSAGTLSVSYTVPYAQQLGLDLVASASVLGLRSWFGALGKILLGWLSDGISPRRVIFGVYVVEIILTLLMIQTRDPLYFSIFGVGLGFVGAAMLPLKGALVAQIFGRASFASAFGLLQTVALPFSFIMLPLAGFIYDSTGDWAVVFGCTIPLFATAALLLVFIKPDEAHQAG